MPGAVEMECNVIETVIFCAAVQLGWAAPADGVEGGGVDGAIVGMI